MKSCPQCQRKLASQAGLKQHMAAVHQGGQQRAKRGNGRVNGGNNIPAGYSTNVPRSTSLGGSQQGVIIVSRTELAVSIDVAAAAGEASKAIKLAPSRNCLPWLSRLAGSFDEIIWHSARVFYKPAVGTNFAGSLVIGMDWNAKATDASREKAQSCSPAMESAAWQPISMVLPSNRLQSRKFYNLSADDAIDQAPGAILYNLKCDTSDKQRFVGDIWIDYKVSLLGPSA